MADLLVFVTFVLYGLVIIRLAMLNYPLHLLINIDVPLLLVCRVSLESQFQSTFVSVIMRFVEIKKSYLLNRKTRPPLIQMA